MLIVENVYTPTQISQQDISEIGKLEIEVAQLKQQLQHLLEQQQPELSQCVAEYKNLEIDSQDKTDIDITSSSKLKLKIDYLLNPPRSLLGFSKKELNADTKAKLSCLNERLQKLNQSRDSVERILQREREKLCEAKKSLPMTINNHLWQAFNNALDEVSQECSRKDREIKRAIYSNIKDVAQKLKTEARRDFYTLDKKLENLKQIIVQAKSKDGKFSRTTDAFSMQQIKRLDEILCAHELNLKELDKKNYSAFTEHQLFGVPSEPPRHEAPVAESAKSSSSNSPELLGVLFAPQAPIAESAKDYYAQNLFVQAQGFFEQYPKTVLASKCLMVASLPTIAYFCIGMFEDFISNLPLPAPLTLALAGLVLGVIAYQFFKPKESIQLEGRGAAI